MDRGKERAHHRPFRLLDLGSHMYLRYLSSVTSVVARRSIQGNKHAAAGENTAHMQRRGREKTAHHGMTRCTMRVSVRSTLCKVRHYGVTPRHEGDIKTYTNIRVLPLPGLVSVESVQPLHRQQLCRTAPRKRGTQRTPDSPESLNPSSLLLSQAVNKKMICMGPSRTRAVDELFLSRRSCFVRTLVLSVPGSQAGERRHGTRRHMYSVHMQPSLHLPPPFHPLLLLGFVYTTTYRHTGGKGEIKAEGRKTHERGISFLPTRRLLVHT
ncbi:hypothetical protein J3F83DRAFT_419189 [Trichoderma novae-zelandiae]